MHYDRDAIVTALMHALEASEWASHETCRDIAFHMTDWLDDLSRLQAFYESPDGCEPAQVIDLLMAFLVHAPSHLAAASKLFTDDPVTDVFGVGATGP